MSEYIYKEKRIASKIGGSGGGPLFMICFYSFQFSLQLKLKNNNEMNQLV